MKQPLFATAMLLTLFSVFSNETFAERPHPGVPTREIVVSRSDFSLSTYEERVLSLGSRYFVWNVRVNVVSNSYGDASGEVWVNGEKRGDVYASRNNPDPAFYIPIERETSAILINSKPVLGQEGRLRVLKITATVSDLHSVQSPDDDSILPINGVRSCYRCKQMGMNFPLHYKTVMGNVSNRAIILSDRLMQYTNYKDLGVYLLPIKKAAAQSRSVAEARGDASAYARPYYEWLLTVMDDAEPYLDDLYERPGVFELATELLSLREYIRDILD